MTAQEGLGPLDPQGSPLWTLQHLGFVPDVAAALPTAERTVTPGRADTTQLTGEARLENGSLLQGLNEQFDRIACVHMSGLFVRPHMDVGQDGFRSAGPKQINDQKRPLELTGYHAPWIDRSHHLLVSCKFAHQFSTVAPVSYSP